MTKKTKCTWIGHGEGCDHHALPERSYCEQHIWRVYVQGSQLSKRKKDIKTATTIHFWESLINEVVEELESEGWTPDAELMEI